MARTINRPTANATLAALRTAASLSQAEVADRINQLAGDPGGGVTGGTVSRWERGVIVPGPHYRRLLAELFNVPVDALGFPDRHTFPDDPLTEAVLSTNQPTVLTDPRLTHGWDQWRATRRALNAHRPELTRLAAELHPTVPELAGTGLVAPAAWIPAEPVDLAAVALTHVAAPPPQVDGTEPESAHVRPACTLTRPYGRYTQAIRDLDHPRLFENRASWRLLDLRWTPSGGRMAFGPTTFFAAVDVNEVLAHEMALVHLTADGLPGDGVPHLRDLPFRRLLGDPFNLARRPVMPAVSTLTIRAGDPPTFLLHRRDSRSVAMAGGMLQVIPSGIFQPSSVLPAAVEADFSLWRNIQREYAEELLGHPEHDGDGRPISYADEPFATMDAARASGAIRVHCLGVALDALTLVGEILTVAVIQPEVFDVMATDFVEVNEEGTVVNERLPFTERVVDRAVKSGRMAPAGAGCLRLAWQHRETLLGAG